jgi:hypothetical protein
VPVAKTLDRVCAEFMISAVFLPLRCLVYPAQEEERALRSARSLRSLAARLRTPICETLVSGPGLTPVLRERPPRPPNHSASTVGALEALRFAQMVVAKLGEHSRVSVIEPIGSLRSQALNASAPKAAQ